MAIRFHEENTVKQKFVRRKIIRWIDGEILRKGKITGEINIIFTTDDFLRTLNNYYLKRNYFTDIISFDYSENRTVSGDLFISTDRVKDNAGIYKNDYYQELFRVIIHGILHLLGFKDSTENEKKVMRKEENRCLKDLNTKQ